MHMEIRMADLTIQEINDREVRPLRPVEYSRTTETYVLKHEDINGQGALFGGRLQAWIDEAGGYAARRHASSLVVTCAIDNQVFKRGAALGDMIYLDSRVTYVGRSSMEVRVDTYVESLDGIRTPINRAYIVYVAVDPEHLSPIPVRYGLEICTESERAEYLGAIRRNEVRKQRRNEGF